MFVKIKDFKSFQKFKTNFFFYPFFHKKINLKFIERLYIMKDFDKPHQTKPDNQDQARGLNNSLIKIIKFKKDVNKNYNSLIF